MLFFFFSLTLKIVTTGILSPIKNPSGFRESMRSKITLQIALKGSDKNIPATPHIAPPNKTTTIEAKALILTLDATTFGTIKLF